MVAVDDVADAVIAELGPMTPMKLEKLVYYSQAWHLARHRRPLFPEVMEAWRQGPVVPHLYEQHQHRRQLRSWPSGDAARLAADERDTVRWVTEAYGGFPAETLSEMTHAEVPWKAARGDLPDDAPSDNPISHDEMATYYGRQRADAKTAVDFAMANAALEGFQFDAAWRATLEEVAAGTLSVEELVRRETVAGGD
jgi:uncharacterized phage-associated protein